MKALSLRIILAAGLCALSSDLVAAGNSDRLREYSETESHLIGTFVDGKEHVVVVEKATGIYSVASPDGSGSPKWSSPVRSGVENVTDVAVGAFGPEGALRLALVSPLANRVQLLDPYGSSIPRAVVSAYPGPVAVAPVDLPSSQTEQAFDDLLIATGLGEAPAWGTLERFFNAGDSAYKLDDLQDYEMPLKDLQHWYAEELDTSYWIARFANGEGDDTTAIMGNDPGEGTMMIDDWIEASEMYSLVTDITYTGILAQVVQYAPGSTGFGYRVIVNKDDAPVASKALSLELGQPIRSMHEVTVDGEQFLLALLANEKEAAANMALLLELSPSGEFTVASVNPVTTGGTFRGAMSSPSGKLMLLTASTGEGPIDGWSTYSLNGSSLALEESGSFPSFNLPEQFANVLLFEKEPLVNESPGILMQLGTGDWSERAQISGSDLNVERSRFASSSEGLVPTSSDMLMPVPANTGYALVNQYSRAISFSTMENSPQVSAGSVSADPAGGTYSAPVQVELSSSEEGMTLYYRTGSAENWVIYNEPFWVLTDATVQFFGRGSSMADTTGIESVSYTITQAPEDQDQDGDGVPDYVELANGLDPEASGNDADGDGVSDLEELLTGYDPANGAHTPSSSERLDLSQSAFDAVISANTYGTDINTREGFTADVLLRVHSPNGSRLGEGQTLPALPPLVSTARINGLSPSGGSGLYVVSTPQKFQLDGGAAEDSDGRELVYAGVVPTGDRPEVDYTFGGGSLQYEASQWVAAAQSAYMGPSTPLEMVVMSPRRTLHAALLEEFIRRFGEREGFIPGEFTLFPGRKRDADAQLLNESIVEQIEAHATQPFRLREVSSQLWQEVSALDANHALIQMARQLYVANANASGAQAARLMPPFDAVRGLLQGSGLNSDHAAAITLNASQQQQAKNEAERILSGIGTRPRVMLDLAVTEQTYRSSCTILQHAYASQDYSLFNTDGTRYDLSEAFDLPQGAILSVYAYTDRDFESCAGQALEVIAATVKSIPLPEIADEDGNTLPDAWENYFAGSTGLNAFSNNDGSGYSNLQQAIAGTDPFDNSSLPEDAPVDLSAPSPRLQLQREAGTFRLSWDYPADYARYFSFELLSAPEDLQPPYTPVDTQVSASGEGGFQLEEPLPGGDRWFYLLQLKLAEMSVEP